MVCIEQIKLNHPEGFLMENNIFEIIENALALAGYKVLDGDKKCVIVRHSATDTDYRITVEEEPC